jgi:hypothetical protein
MFTYSKHLLQTTQRNYTATVFSFNRQVLEGHLNPLPLIDNYLLIHQPHYNTIFMVLLQSGVLKFSRHLREIEKF